MRRPHTFAAPFALLLFIASTSSAQVGDILEVRMPIEPSPVAADGQVHLAYELHVTNLSWNDAVLTGLHAVSTEDDRSLAAIEGPRLRLYTRIIGTTELPRNNQGVPLDAGATAHVFMWLSVDPSEKPTSITHRFNLFSVTADGDTTLHAFATAPLAVGPEAVVIAPPVRGGDWWIVDGNGRALNLTGHRRASVITTNGRVPLAQRFARDFGKLVDGSTMASDREGNAAFPSWGEEAVAVVDGIVVRIEDGVPENEFPGHADVVLTRETLLGNSVVLDIGDGRYAVYGHLQPGLPVKVGDRVRKGQTVGLIGHSGSSGGPHLHFQINDDPSPLSGEGLPFAVDRFEIMGRKTGFESPAEMTEAEQRRGELLVETRVVRFQTN